ncbi:MAG: class I SAM-dependent methyltransferase [Bacteroidia bacterium]|nr:class I SAM-dependent methyltransferase [Bacteroidia bacterium]
MKENSILITHDHWDNLYSGDLDKLPWINNPFPIEIFKKYVDQLQFSENILDYGTGTGRYFTLLKETGANITCLDISKKALSICKANHPDAIVIPAETPISLADNFFNGILCWGVLHHIHPDSRATFWSSLSMKIKGQGLILLGGWSQEDPEHNGIARISPITKQPTWDIDFGLHQLINGCNLKIIQSGCYPFIESFTQNKRLFSYYLIKKI